jgi:hypothetical protein
VSKSWKYVLVAAASLAVGAVGTAGAAGLITGSQIKNGTIEVKDLSKKAQKALKGATGPAGPVGAAGASGGPGGAGTSGSPGPSLVSGTMSAEAGLERFSPPSGGATFATEPGAKTPVPPGAGLTARDFIVSVPAAPGAGKSITLTLMLNGAPTGLSCAISGAAATSCQAAGATLALPAGGLLAMRSVATAGATATSAGWAFRVVF